MTERSANDTTTPARLVLDAYIIDPVTKLPMAPGVASGGATEAEQQAQTAILEDIKDAAEDTAPVSVAMAQDEYESVAASQTDVALGATGAAGDYIAALVIQPAGTAPGAVTLKDGASTVYSWPGTSSYPADLRPLIVPLGIKSKSGAWTVTTGANVSVLAEGDFT